MSTNIYLKELKRYRNSVAAWTVAIGALIFLGMVFYPVLMEGNTLRQLTAFFENPFMKNILSAFGVSLNAMIDPLGYYVTRNAIFVLLLGSFFSILLAGKILSREEHEKTAEFLLAKPVTRSEVVGSKVAAFFTCLVGLNAVIVIIGFISLEIYKGNHDYRAARYLVHCGYCFLLMMSLGAAGLFLSVLIKRGRPITNISIGIVTGAYIIDVLSRVTESADKIGYLSPFKFVDSNVLLPHYGLVWWRVLYFLGISFMLIALTFVIYKRKDILV
ncbi:MAG: ABC transporter permease subunit [Candidatus Aminicenantes bacterium]|nr:ABC transporter permease subunit [Candidatus Aminicenantes bacterium]